MDQIIVHETGNQLLIDSEGDIDHKVYIEIATPELYSLIISGQHDVSLKGFDQSEFTLNVIRQSEVNADINVDELYAEVTGNSELILRGNGKKSTFNITGNSSLNSPAFESDKIYLEVSGVSEVALGVSSDLTVNASGDCEVTYRGNPKIYTELNGSSTITKNNFITFA